MAWWGNYLLGTVSHQVVVHMMFTSLNPINQTGWIGGCNEPILAAQLKVGNLGGGYPKGDSFYLNHGSVENGCER